MFLFKQILRWSRNTIRSDFKALFLERNVWKKYPFLAIVMFDRFISPITMTLGLIFILLGSFNLFSAPQPEFITKWGTNGSGNGEFDSPHDVTVDSSGNIYVIDNLLFNLLSYL